MLKDRYAIERKLGEGASAVVFLAEDRLTKKTVAIKRAHEMMARHARFAGRWQREVIVLQTLQHPRIVPLVDATFEKGKPLTMVMAYAPEGDLDEKLLQGCTVQQALEWLYQTLEGLAYIHSFGVIHQDIKPENILIGPEKNAWLADFSVARTRAELLTNPQDVTGTPGWYAPEQQMRLAAEVGPWTDLFPFGKMLENVLTAMSYRSMEFSFLVEGCTALDPQERFRTSSEVLPLLRKAIDALPASVRARRMKVKPKRGMTNLLKEGFQCADTTVPTSRRGEATLSLQPVEALPATLSPSLLSVVPRFKVRTPILKDLWDAAKWVKENKKNRVVFIKGPKGSGRKDVIRHFVRQLQYSGVMDSMILSYHQNDAYDDGYRGAVQNLLSPWGENRVDFSARVQRWLAREKQLTFRETRRESVGLAKWCGFLESNEQAVDNGHGLIFLFQYLQHLSWKGATALVLEDPEHCTIHGDGLDICETLLGEEQTQRPVLILTTIPEEYEDVPAQMQHKIEVLKKMGAQELYVPAWTDSELLEHISEVCTIPKEWHPSVLKFCEGKIHRANLFVQSLALQDRMQWSEMSGCFEAKEGKALELSSRFFDDFFHQLLQTVPQPELARDVLAAMVCSDEPVEQLLINEISPVGLQELIQVGILHQQGRSIRFAYPELRQVVKRWVKEHVNLPQIQRKIAEAWMELVERWDLRLDLQIGQAWLAAGEAQKALPFLLLAIQDARNAWLWERTEQIADLIETAATQTGSHVGLVEGRLNRLEVRIKRGVLQDVQELALQIEKMGQLDAQSMGRLALIHADYLMQQKQWVASNQYLRQALEFFSKSSDRRGSAQTYLKQGYLLLVLNRLEGAADRFAQASMISPKSTTEWVESQARLIEIRLRLGWVDGLPKQIDGIWRQTQANGDVHHMAYATYIAGLLLMYQLRLPEALVRLQTTQTLASSCGDSELRAQSLEALGALFFLDGNWSQARQIQKQLLFHYQMRKMRDRGRVSLLRLRCTYALSQANPNPELWKMELPDLEKSFVHVQYWWWMFRLLNPANTEKEIQQYWENASKMTEIRVWDVSLYRMLHTLLHEKRFQAIHSEVDAEIVERFAKQRKYFRKIPMSFQ